MTSLPILQNGANYGTRTRDLLLGKETYYQLYEARVEHWSGIEPPTSCMGSRYSAIELPMQIVQPHLESDQDLP